MTATTPGSPGAGVVEDGIASTATGEGPRNGAFVAFTGWFDLLRLLVRRDRIQLLIWVAAAFALVIVSAVSIDGLYPTQVDRYSYASLVHGNAAVVVQVGPGYGLESNPSLGNVLMNEVSMWTIVLVAYRDGHGHGFAGRIVCAAGGGRCHGQWAQPVVAHRLGTGGEVLRG